MYFWRAVPAWLVWIGCSLYKPLKSMWLSSQSRTELVTNYVRFYLCGEEYKDGTHYCGGEYGESDLT